MSKILFLASQYPIASTLIGAVILLVLLFTAFALGGRYAMRIMRKNRLWTVEALPILTKQAGLVDAFCADFRALVGNEDEANKLLGLASSVLVLHGASITPSMSTIQHLAVEFRNKAVTSWYEGKHEDAYRYFALAMAATKIYGLDRRFIHKESGMIHGTEQRFPWVRMRESA